MVHMQPQHFASRCQSPKLIASHKPAPPVELHWRQEAGRCISRVVLLTQTGWPGQQRERLHRARFQASAGLYKHLVKDSRFVDYARALRVLQSLLENAAISYCLRPRDDSVSPTRDTRPAANHLRKLALPVCSVIFLHCNINTPKRNGFVHDQVSRGCEGPGRS